MKTMEERIDEVSIEVGNNCADFYSHEIDFNVIEDGLRQIATELIDKAREWFGQYLMEIGYPDDWLRDSPNMKSGEQRFCEAMKK